MSGNIKFLDTTVLLCVLYFYGMNFHFIIMLLSLASNITALITLAQFYYEQLTKKGIPVI